MPLRPSTEPAFTLVLNNRDYSPPSRAYFREIWYPPSPEPFSKFDPLMRTVDIRDIDSWSWRSDLCVPALSDISEEEVQDGTVMIPDEVMESLSVKKRPRILLALEDLVYTFRSKCRKLRPQKNRLPPSTKTSKVNLLAPST